MFDLLSPIWLTALAALAVPVAIHLWSRRGRRVIRVGSTKLLQASVQRRAHRFFISEWPLLLLQLALLAVLVVMLARPVWHKSQFPAPEPEKWMLVSAEVINPEPDSASLYLIDSLEAEGYVTRLLAPGFPPFREVYPGMTTAAPIWSLLREADAVLPAGSQVAVAAPLLHAHFSGRRPAIGISLDWYPFDPGSENRWIESARREEGDSLRLTIGVSRATETFFNTFALPFSEEISVLSEEGLPAVEISPEQVGGAVRLLTSDPFPEDDERSIAPAFSIRRALIVHQADRALDARYVRAAMETAAEFLRIGLGVTVREISEDSNIEPFAADRPEIVFWLSSNPAPDVLQEWMEAGSILIRDATSSTARPVDTGIYTSGMFDADPPRLALRAPAVPAGAPYWTDGFGDIVMIRQRSGNGEMYTFFSRFNPGWTNLVRHPLWPGWMVHLLDRENRLESSRYANSDRRQLGGGQQQPRHERPEPDDLPAPPRSMDFLFWMLAAALFAFEYGMGARILNRQSEAVQS